VPPALITSQFECRHCVGGKCCGHLPEGPVRARSRSSTSLHRVSALRPLQPISPASLIPRSGRNVGGILKAALRQQRTLPCSHKADVRGATAVWTGVDRACMKTWGCRCRLEKYSMSWVKLARRQRRLLNLLCEHRSICYAPPLPLRFHTASTHCGRAITPKRGQPHGAQIERARLSKNGFKAAYKPRNSS
jgi:hypothetical protein